MPKRKPIAVEYQTLVVIWFALLLSQIVFLAFVYFIRPDLIGAKPDSESLSVGAASITGGSITLSAMGTVVVNDSAGL